MLAPTCGSPQNLWERVYANTGRAGARHRVNFFAAKAAPTGCSQDQCAPAALLRSLSAHSV
ncbi:MAG: hypothetical protein K0S77_1641 [Pseudomonas sp.]|jgi:hypothetical protein|nr:hypothetical protein [Pseudomonas sp.]